MFDMLLGNGREQTNSGFMNDKVMDLETDTRNLDGRVQLGPDAVISGVNFVHFVHFVIKVISIVLV